MKKISLTLLFLCSLHSAFSYATLISRDSSLGNGSITFDTTTYSEWIDPWLTIVPTAGGSGCCNNYDDVRAMLAPGGRFDGFRFATRDEVENLLFNSAHIDPVTAASFDTATAADIAAIGSALSLFDTTFGNGFTSILDARFEDEGELGRSILTHSTFGSGKYSFINDPFADSRVDPIGNWLVRVDEPVMFPMLAVALAGLLWRRSRAA